MIEQGGSARDADEQAAPRRSRRRRWLIISLSAVLVIALGVGGWSWWFLNEVSSNIERIPGAFDDVPKEERPPEEVTEEGSLTFLLGGLDGADLLDNNEPGSARTDTIMVVHIPKGRDKAYVVSIPRDTWIEIPGHGQGKINWAYPNGGPSLFIHTLEQLIGFRIDHLALIDWSGFETLTDELDGVPIHLDDPAELYKGGMLEAGDHVLTGEQALAYVRERKGLPGGDFDRVKRQHNYLRALMDKLLSSGTLTNPTKIGGVTDAIGEAARVDDQLSATDLAQLALSMRDLRSTDVTFLTVPNLGTGQAGEQSIVVYDEARAAALWSALADNTIDAFLAENPDLITGADIN